MRTRSISHRSALAVGLGSLLVSTAACAGPRVGQAVGVPSSTSAMINARVLSATPVVAQVAVPRQVCYDELRQQPARSSGAGALLGAIAGGAVGNALGQGAGRALATGAGIFGGAVLGDHIENDGRQGTTATVRRCEQQATYENQVVAYDVVYEYAGQQYTTQTTREPGRTIPIQLTVSPAMESPPPMSVAPVAAPVVTYEQQGYYPAPVMAPPVVIETNYVRPAWGFYGHRHHRHGW